MKMIEKMEFNKKKPKNMNNKRQNSFQRIIFFSGMLFLIIVLLFKVIPDIANKPEPEFIITKEECKEVPGIEWTEGDQLDLKGNFNWILKNKGGIYNYIEITKCKQVEVKGDILEWCYADNDCGRIKIDKKWLNLNCERTFFKEAVDNGEYKKECGYSQGEYKCLGLNYQCGAYWVEVKE